MQGVSGTSGALSGLNWSYNPATGVLDLQNAATTAVYQNVLRRITFYRISGVYSSTTRTIDFSIISSLYCAATGHYYEYVNSFKNWEAAKTEAAGRTYFGLQGYLATVTSQAENSFILGKLQGWGWIGATDNLTKPEWYWVTGPEGAANGGIGTNFFTQKRATFNSPDRVTVFGGNIGSGGDAIPGFYNNWSPDQPDDSGPTGEYFAHIYKNDGFHTDGTWNDYIGAIQGYVVEYGGMAGDPALQLTGNVTVNILYPQAVGGEVAQVNKPALLVPALVIGAVLMLGGTILVLSRRKRG
jgi:hypothetical protein